MLKWKHFTGNHCNWDQLFNIVFSTFSHSIFFLIHKSSVEVCFSFPILRFPRTPEVISLVGSGRMLFPVQPNSCYDGNQNNLWQTQKYLFFLPSLVPSSFQPGELFPMQITEFATIMKKQWKLWKGLVSLFTLNFYSSMLSFPFQISHFCWHFHSLSPWCLLLCANMVRKITYNRSLPWELH